MLLLKLVLGVMVLAAGQHGMIVFAAAHGGGVGSGAVRFANSLGSSMVLQQAPASAQVYGEGPAGQKLEVTLQQSASGSITTAEGKVSVTISPDGRWVAKLPPVAAASPFSDSIEAYTITAKSGQSSAVLDDVVFGDVIVCGGQVRMHLPTCCCGLLSQHKMRNRWHWHRRRILRSSAASQEGHSQHHGLARHRWEA
eukprot:COSAG02_NODE_317_length_24808_cov_120.564329_17_plen_197_part_00